MPGVIIVRQRGTAIINGKNVKRGSDDTLFSMAKGTVKFHTKKLRNFHGTLSTRTIVDVIPA